MFQDFKNRESYAEEIAAKSLGSTLGPFVKSKGAQGVFRTQVPDVVKPGIRVAEEAAE